MGFDKLPLLTLFVGKSMGCGVPGRAPSSVLSGVIISYDLPETIPTPETLWE